MNGEVQETGDFELDGVTFPAAEIPVAFMDPADGEGATFPTGNLVDDLNVPGVEVLESYPYSMQVSPMVFINAADIGYRGTELENVINGDCRALSMF